MTKICLIAGNEEEALRYAKTQNIPRDCWFYPATVRDLLFRSNFYVLVVGTGGQNVSATAFETLYQLALQRGKIDRR